MNSTFGSIIVHKDDTGYHILHSLPRNFDESSARRMQYAGPRVIMRETFPDINKWMADRKKEGFTFTE